MGRATAELLAAKAFGGRFLPVDVTDFAGTEQALADAVDEIGALHVGVTTAGGGIAARTIGKDGPHDLQEFRDVSELNTVATFNISRLAAAHMARNEPEDDERGVIVNTSSIAAFEGQIGQVAYTAAFPKRMGRPEEYAKLAVAIVDNPMPNAQCLRLDAGQRFAPR